MKLNRLTNRFHETEARTRYNDEQIYYICNKSDQDRTSAEKALVRRLHDKLCGSTDCTCGDDVGRR